MTDPETRITDLEERLAHQDRAIEDLNETITDQWKEIEKLRRELARLGDQVREVEGVVGEVTGKEPPPPHY